MPDKPKETEPLIVRRLTIENFRGVKNGAVDFKGHTLLVGGNNTGKSTICEALELVLGPERAYRRPIVNEHDFHAGCKIRCNNQPMNWPAGFSVLSE